MTQNSRRIIRASCDLVMMAAAVNCLIGLTVSGFPNSLTLLKALGVAVGVLTGLAQSKKSRTVSGLLIVAMTFCHVHIQIVTASIGMYNQLSLYISFYSAVVLLQAVPWAIDWWVFRNVEIQDSLPVRQQIWRLVTGTTSICFAVTVCFGAITLIIKDLPSIENAIGVLTLLWFSAGSLLLFVSYWDRTIVSGKFCNHDPNLKLKVRSMFVAVICKVASIVAWALTATSVWVAAAWAVVWIAFAGVIYVVRREFRFTNST